jgi:hypothetical protein
MYQKSLAEIIGIFLLLYLYYAPSVRNGLGKKKDIIHILSQRYCTASDSGYRLSKIQAETASFEALLLISDRFTQVLCHGMS